MTTKKVILLSAATYFALNIVTWLIGWLAWPVVFIGIWIFLGCVARKVSSYGNLRNDRAWNYIMCNLVPPIVIGLECFDNYGRISHGLKQEYNIFNKLPSFPKFRNPFVWPEKEEK